MKNTNKPNTTINKVWKTIVLGITFFSLFATLTSCTADEVETKKQTQNTVIDPPIVITKPLGH